MYVVYFLRVELVVWWAVVISVIVFSWRIMERSVLLISTKFLVPFLLNVLSFSCCNAKSIWAFKRAEEGRLKTNDKVGSNSDGSMARTMIIIKVGDGLIETMLIVDLNHGEPVGDNIVSRIELISDIEI